MRLSTLVRLSGRRICIPSAGYAAVSLSGTTVSENLKDGERMYRTLETAVSGFGLEADGTISDLTIEPEACGCPVVIPDNDTPYVSQHPYSKNTDTALLEVPDPALQPRMQAMTEAVRLLTRRFTLPTVAGGSGPFTLAAELVGASEAAIYTITDREFLHRLLEYCTAVCTRYLQTICDAGAEIILIGEPTATILSAEAYREFSGRYTARIIESLKRPVILHICGDASHLLEAMSETGAQGLSLDAPVDMPAAAGRVPRKVVVIGNVNTVSVLLEGTPGEVRLRTTELLESMRPYPNFVLSSGCDLSYHTPPENILAMIDTVRRFR